MTQCYMITRPRAEGIRESIQEVKILQFMLDNDVHKFIVGKEIGTMGYRHWQIRIKIRNLTDEEKKDYSFLKAGFGSSANIAECSDTWEYESKDGNYWDEGDFILSRIERLYTRLGTPNDEWQAQYLNLIETQNVRTVDVAYDPKGNRGKSWLINHLVETGRAYYIPPSMATVEKVVQSVASYYLDNPWRDYVVIDIPRGYEWSIKLCVAIEQIKDGLVTDTRYKMRCINIRGVKVIVCTNNEIPQKVYSSLSKDRWRVSTLS